MDCGDNLLPSSSSDAAVMLLDSLASGSLRPGGGACLATGRNIASGAQNVAPAKERWLGRHIVGLMVVDWMRCREPVVMEVNPRTLEGAEKMIRSYLQHFEPRGDCVVVWERSREVVVTVGGW